MTPLQAQRPRSDRGFDRLYRRHVGDVYRYALALMCDPADAKDVTRTTFLNAYRSFVGQGERPAKAQSWLIEMAHDVCVRRLRPVARRPADVAYPEDVPTVSERDIRRALARLPLDQRGILILRELERCSCAEIREILELSASGVESLLFHARRALREHLEANLTCSMAERAISRRLDGRLPRSEQGRLRAHLRECAECEAFARRQRLQRRALRALGAVPVPPSLATAFGLAELACKKSAEAAS